MIAYKLGIDGAKRMGVDFGTYYTTPIHFFTDHWKALCDVPADPDRAEVALMDAEETWLLDWSK